eukprot:15367020-Ditylum_brightwellii.AAC.1
METTVEHHIFEIAAVAVDIAAALALFWLLRIDPQKMTMKLEASTKDRVVVIVDGVVMVDLFLSEEGLPFESYDESEEVQLQEGDTICIVVKEPI